MPDHDAGAVAAAGRARGPQPLWAIVPAEARARFLRRSAQALLDEVDDLAAMLASEAGVPRTEALVAELLPSVGGLRALADEGAKALSELRLGRRPVLRAGRRSVLVQAPVGIVGIRGGQASPWAEPALEAAAALLAGNGVVLAPAVAAAGERLVSVFARAGLPEGLLQLAEPGTDLAALEAACDRALDTEPGRPKGTMLVLEGAPLDRAVSGALWAGFARGGGGPGAVGRVVAVASVAGPLLEGLEAETRRLRVGDPRDPRTEVGPLRSPEHLARVREIVDEAVAAGATLVCGGPVDGSYFAPAVLRDVPPDARLLREPVPGPVLAVVEAAGEAEAIALTAADHPAAVSVWTGDRAQGERVARVIGAGQTWVNDHGGAAPAALVRLAHHVESRHLGSQPAPLRSARWLPHDPVLVRAATATTRLMHGRESERLAALRDGAIPLLRVAVRLGRDALRR